MNQQINPLNSYNDQNHIDSVHFGTDGWRAIIDEDFNPRSVARVADAAARVFRAQQLAGEHADVNAEGVRFASDTATDNPGRCAAAGDAATDPATDSNTADNRPNTIIIGYDCRLDAGRYAVLVATVVAAHGFDVVVSDRYCPTPTLCWTLFRDPQAVGGFMLTSSHNPSEWLGIKLRMADGGASPQSFTNKVEAALRDELPACYDEALAQFAAATNGTPDAPTSAAAGGVAVTAPAPATPAAAAPAKADALTGAPANRTPSAPHFTFADLTAPYLASLADLVDRKTIAAAKLRIVLDPLYGAGRSYLASLLRSLDVEVVEVNGDTDPSFNGLHPEPIMPWVRVGAEAVRELGYDACFVTDGDADRIGALDENGTYVTSHRILALLIGHLVENRGQTGRVVRTQAGSNLLRRQCERLGLTLTTKPIGFKWIYEEMLAGDVLIGGEESGGIGIPAHVRERDGLLMTLMLTELMAQTGKKLHELVANLLSILGTLEYNRRDLRLTPEQMEALLSNHVCQGDVSPDTLGTLPDATYRELFSPLGEDLTGIDRTDGIKFNFASDAWLLVRPSGTEPLVRVYAEAEISQQVESLLDVGCALAQGN